MRLEFTQSTQVLAYIFKLLSQEKSTHEEKVRFIKRNELKVTQFEILPIFIFKRIMCPYLPF